MKKADYNRVISLYKNCNVPVETCIQIIIQLTTDSYRAALHIYDFLVDTGQLK
jgi:hypothetical protein